MTELLSMRDICRMLKVHPNTVRRWIRAGDFPKPKLKKRQTQRWDADAVNKYCATVTNRD